MPEEKIKSQKRQVSFKLRIKDILMADYLKEEGWNPNYLLLADKRKVSRINVIGTIISKSDIGSSSYQSIIIDDGSGSISIRTFEDAGMLRQFEIGDTLLIVGRPREFGKERYIVPEITKRINDLAWVGLRNLEIGAVQKKVSVEGKKVLETYDYDEEDLDDGNDVASIVRRLDKGDGADFNDIIDKMKKPDAERIIKNLIKMGELFEIRPGRIKVLE